VAYRNVSAFGAVGDGVTDDTLALQKAIDFNRGGDAGSEQSKSAAVVYLPAGTYKVTDTLVLWKWTVLIGNPHCPPTIVLPASTPAFSGAKGLRPLLVTTVGFNTSTAAHAWWEQSGPNDINENFFTSVRHLRVVIGAGNLGAVGVSWNVAQQTALRDVEVTAANDTAVALDLGAGSDYEALPQTAHGQSAGGVVEDVVLRGAKTGLRVSVAQAVFKNVAIEGSTVNGLHVHRAAWSFVAMNLSVAGAPLGVQIDGTLPGTIQLLDCALSGISTGIGISTDGKTAVLLQNLRTDSSVTHVVDKTLKRSASGAVALWAQGEAYTRGKSTFGFFDGHRGLLPLPTLASAKAQAITLACQSSAAAATGVTTPHLCGGSASDPSTGAPYFPRPLFDDSQGVLNVLSAGAFGDGGHDDTKALQAAITKSRTVFIPWGIYMISSTLILRPDSRIIGEGYSILRMMPHSFGQNEPLVSVPPSANASIGVALADISLWNADCGNDKGLMMAWEGSPASSVHDMNMLISTTVAAKAVILGAGGGYMSNTWWPATMSYQPAVAVNAAKAKVVATQNPDGNLGRRSLDLRREGEAAAVLTPAGVASLRTGFASAYASNATTTSTTSAPPLPCPPSLTEVGVLIGSTGPMWHIGVNLEHSSVLEVGLEAGSANHMFVGLQTEEAPIALNLNSTKNSVVWGALMAFWNASESSPAQVVAFRPSPVSGKDLDASYRLYGLGVPISKSEKALLIDSGRYELSTATGKGFSMAVAVLN
jgi:hypothetical protein